MLLKSFGIDVQEIERTMKETITKLQSGIQGLDNRLTSIDTRLERLERHLGVENEQPEHKPALRVLS